MKVIPDEKTRTYVLVPVEKEEQEVLSRLVELLTPGDMLHYVKLERDWISDDRWFESIHFDINGTSLIIKGSTLDDKRKVEALYWGCARAYGSLVFLGAIEAKDGKAIVVTGGYCKLCGRAMIDFHGGWRKQYIIYVCESCSVKCEHRWKWEDVEDAQMTIASWVRCELCGRSQVEMARLTQALLCVEDGISIPPIYKGTPLTPRQVACLQKLAD